MTGTDCAEIQVNADAGLVEARFRGDVALADLVRTSRCISEHSGFQRGMHTLADFSKARLRLDYADMDRFRGYVWSIEALRGDCRWAAVATRSPSRESITLFAAMATAYEMRIQVRHFYATEDALAWLGGQ